MNYQFNHRVINIPQTYEHNIDRWRNSIKNSIHNLLDRCSFDCKNSFNCSKAYNFTILTALFYGHIFCTCIHLNLCTCSDARKLYKNGMFLFYFGAVNRDNDGFDSTHRIYDANAAVVVCWSHSSLHSKKFNIRILTSHDNKCHSHRIFYYLLWGWKEVERKCHTF